MDILLRKKVPTGIFLRQIKRRAHDNVSMCLLNTKPFYHGLIEHILATASGFWINDTLIFR